MNIDRILNELKESGNYRRLYDFDSVTAAQILIDSKSYINLSSNDYLGLSTNFELQNQFLDTLIPSSVNKNLMSNPSSRLMSGNSCDYKLLEDSIAAYFLNNHKNYNFSTTNSDPISALVVGSGYLLNSGLYRAITQKGDLILADKLVHSSIVDGLKLCEAQWNRFRHNDMTHLESLLNSAESRRVVVVVESLYSMDGDWADFKALGTLQKKYKFELVVDAAHSFAVMDPLDIEAVEISYFIATMGKALSSSGAFVVCSSRQRELLVNRMPTVIFSTALPPVVLQWSRFIIERLESFHKERQQLQRLIKITGTPSWIVPIIIGSNQQVLELSERLKEKGYWATAIRHPTVARGKERVRVSLNAAHSEQQIKNLCDIIG